jgi:hypothetical protein
MGFKRLRESNENEIVIGGYIEEHQKGKKKIYLKYIKYVLISRSYGLCSNFC